MGYLIGHVSIVQGKLKVNITLCTITAELNDLRFSCRETRQTPGIKRRVFSLLKVPFARSYQKLQLNHGVGLVYKNARGFKCKDQ